MSDKRQQVWESLADPDYRRDWAAEHVSVGLAFQIRALRESRGWTQSELGACTGKAQETVSQLENPNYGRVTLSTLKKLAAVFDVGLLVRFVPFSELVNWAVDVTPKRLAPPCYADEAMQNQILETQQNVGTPPAMKLPLAQAVAMRDWLDCYIRELSVPSEIHMEDTENYIGPHES